MKDTESKMSELFPELFSPCLLGDVEIANRLALTATLTNYARDCQITDKWRDFLVERARGGTGLLVSEIIAVDPEAIAHQAIVSGFDGRNDAAFARTASAVHEAGSRIVGQLWHPGRQQLWQPTRSPMGVSAQPDAYSWTVPHVMSDADLERLVEAFIDVAIRLAGTGFDGIELHGAHGYLLTQLLSPWSNTRTGRYGGDRAGRAQFCIQIAKGIRARVPHGFIVGLKMPAREGVEGGIDAAEAAALTTLLTTTGAFDYFAYGQGNFSVSLEDHVPDLHYKPGHFLKLHKQMRVAANGVPVMALGRIGTPELAEQVLADGHGDLVGMSRALVADAAFANKARSGNTACIRPSVYNNICWGEVHAGKPLAEFHNPELATTDEHSYAPPHAEAARRVAVVGAGPAGLECAWKAAARGHQVTLFGAHIKAGGKLRLEAVLPGLSEMYKLVEYQLLKAGEHHVQFKLGAMANASQLTEFDVVMLACGAECTPPALESDGSTPAVSVHDLAHLLEDGKLAKGQRAVLFDHDQGAMTYAAVDALAAHFSEVIVATPRTHLAQAMNYCSALGVHRRLHMARVQQLVATEPVRIHVRGVRTRNVFTHALQTIDDVDLFVYATPRRANDALLSELEGQDVRLIGDCQSPRNLMMAVHHGHLAALAIT